MSKECLLVAISNQKGGVGKSALTVVLASYLHYEKDLNCRNHRLRLTAAQPRAYA